MLVGLAALECRRLQLPARARPAGGDDAVGDVRRIEPMVRDRRQRLIARRSAVHERRRPQRRLADRPAIEVERLVALQPVVDLGGQLHEQVVRVLPVDQRLAVRDLAGGEQVGVAARPHQRLQRAHRAQLQVQPVAQVAVAHQHRHRLDERLVAAARAALRGSDAPGIAVRHQHPLADVRHVAAHRALGRGQARGAGALLPPAAARPHRHPRHRRARRRPRERGVGGGAIVGRGGEAHVVARHAVAHRGVVRPARHVPHRGMIDGRGPVAGMGIGGRLCGPARRLGRRGGGGGRGRVMLVLRRRRHRQQRARGGRREQGNAEHGNSPDKT